ncbi:MAG: hypothetical protein QNI87_15535 [Erythrobacter sp.]|uniref:hypothetical protein n=1 Tax=Erythrobacter sp. TaxID=1042 RepID=UPI00262C608F|nr:hypothetical protein [Erythrobacter sp.]MDJ0979937.1 hypothetical protein [Erythrobacter sp.]
MYDTPLNTVCQPRHQFTPMLSCLVHTPAARSPTRSVEPVRGALFSLVLVLASGAMMSDPALAQENPNTFTLPEAGPSPEPSPETQGPADERSGVPIAPRVIPVERVLPEGERTPAPTSEPGSPPTQAAPSPNADPARAPATLDPSLAESIDALGTQSPSNESLRNEGLRVDSSPTGPARPSASPSGTGDAPGTGQKTDQGARNVAPGGFLLGKDDWVDIAPAPSIDLGPARDPLPEPLRAAPVEPNSIPNLWWALLALAVGAIGFVGWRLWRRRRSDVLLLESNVIAEVRRRIPESSTASPSARGVAAEAAESRAEAQSPRARATEAESEPDVETAFERPSSTERVEPTLTTPPEDEEPARLSLKLDVTKATRSVMMFTLNYRLTVTNRSDEAVRDLIVSGEIASAQRGASNGGSFAKGQAMGRVERIGPQQGVTLFGTLELPMVDVRLIRHGSIPVFIPLVHVTVEGAGQRAHTRSFVVGTPSGQNHLRLHPIAMDGPPGAVTGLRANPIKPPVAQEPA